MSSNEFIEKEEVEAKKAKKEKRKPARKKKEGGSTGRLVVRIMNGEFLSKDTFINNLPFTFYVAFLLVVMIAWGYYAETVTKEEVQLEKELSELDAEYFTLSSEYNTRLGRQEVTRALEGTGVKESTSSPRKIRVRKYKFD